MTFKAHLLAGALVAAALATAEAAGASGADFETAFHVGVEIACKLNHSIAARHYGRKLGVRHS